MNFDGVLSTIALGVLVVIFASILRRRATDRRRFWFFGWVLVLMHFAVQWLGFPWGGPVVASTLEVNTLLLAGLSFYIAVAPICDNRRMRLVLAICFGLPNCLYCALVIANHASPPLLYGILLAELPCLCYIHHRTTHSRVMLSETMITLMVSSVVIAYLVHEGDYEMSICVILTGLFSINALLFYRHYQRLSAGVCTSVLGFLAWGAVWPISNWLDVAHPTLNAPPVVWNFPKFFVAVGMILTLLEEETRSASEAAERNRDIYDRSLCALFRSSLDGILLDCNDILVQYSGLGSREQLIGTSALFDYTNPKAREGLLDKLLTQGVVENFEFRLRDSRGHVRHTLLNAKLRRDEQGRSLDIEGALLDITDRLEAESALRRSEEQHRQLVEGAPVGIYRTTPDGRILFANSTLVRLLGYSSLDELGARNIEQNPATITPRAMFRQRIEAAGTIDDFECEWLRKDGSRIIMRESARVVRNPDNSIAYYEGVLEDVTDRHQLLAQLVHQAQHDALTGLPNRLLIEDRLRQSLARSDRQNLQTALLCVDLDRFKFVNDTYGHAIGDGFLREVVARISERLRATDTFGRIGGDEFLIVLDEIRSEHDAEIVAEHIQQVLRTPLHIEGHAMQASVSIGIAIYPQDAKDAVSLRRYADHALYRSKRLGRGLYQCYSQCHAEAADDIELEFQLSNALEEGRFELHYQPLWRTDGTPTGVEALLRFRHPEQGLLPPHRFVAITERNGLITRIGEWVISEACRHAREWREAGLPPMSVSVNVSPLQFSRLDFAAMVARVLSEEQMPPELLELELTESVVMSNVEESAEQMARLKQLGIRIAVDDFGTGYSSLSYLHRLPLDILKIDRSFIENIAELNGTRPIVEAIISLATTLGMQTVAEGIETKEQFDILKALHCEMVQGFLFARPVPAEEIPGILQTGWRSTHDLHYPVANGKVYARERCLPPLP